MDGIHLDRRTLLTGAALTIVTAAAWVATVLPAAAPTPGSGSGPANGDAMAAGPMGVATGSADGMAEMALAFSAGGAASYLVAWTVMMAAMMLPSAAPMILLYDSLHRPPHEAGRRGAAVAIFTLAYLLAWLTFGALAYLAHGGILLVVDSLTLASSLLPYGLALLLVTAGVFQFSALKHRCLVVCQSPISFLMNNWESGYAGGLRLGFRHALYCLGCCWGLMVVLVGAGAMALNWVLLIAAVVFAEKLLPGSRWTTRVVGAGLIIVGLLVALRPEVAVALRMWR